MSLADEIEDVVRKYDHVSFAELPGKLGRDDLDGDCAVFPDGRPNTIIWHSMSAEYAAAVIELMRDKRVYAHPGSSLLYFIDGAVPSMPMAKRPGKGDYKKPHWLPVTLRAVPLDD